ncbi:MAG: hypothetical protein ACR2KQ_06275 [Actinomycetota bacterium]
MNRSHRMVWLLAALAVALAAVATFALERPGSDMPVPPAEEWVTVASVEEVERDVLYVPEHELFVSTMSPVPEGFIALSAWTPAEEDGGEPRRMLYCTQSNLFENQHGDVYDRVGHELEGRERMSRIPLRVRVGMVEVIPTRLDRNDLDRGTFAVGPPCGEWGDVEEGPPGYALATDAPAEENKATIRPTRLKAGQRAEIHFSPGRQISGLRWDLYRLEDTGLWMWRGLFVGGPGRKSYFDLPPIDPGGGIDDVGIGGIYSIDARIPEELEPGNYRIATYTLKGGRKPVEERIVWHYADFKVVPDPR